MEDSTKVDWKYNAKDIPSFEVTKKVDGEMVTIDNRKKQQDFFLKEIELINEAIKSATYDIGENKSASMNNSLTSSQIFDEDGDDSDAEFVMESSATVTNSTKKVNSPLDLNADDDDDLPF
jgi:hypothetical protein